MCEIWEDIEGYEGLYQISNYGRVKSLERIDCKGHMVHERIMKQKMEKFGYCRVSLSKDGKSKQVSVHRLVAEAYVKRKNPSDNIVNHIDNDPSNNSSDNLEWTTYKGNMEWAAKQGRMKANEQAYKNMAKSHEARKKAVIAITPAGERIKFNSLTEAGKVLGVNSYHIADVCKKEYGYNRLKGYDFEFADPKVQAMAKPKRKKMEDAVRSELRRKRMLGNTINVGRKPPKSAAIASKKLFSKPIIQMDKKGNVIAEFSSVTEAKEKTEIPHTYDVANGKRKSAGGYLWMWKGENNEKSIH